MKPEPLKDADINLLRLKACDPFWFANAVIAARDAQWEAMLDAQEPVAWLISSKDWWPESVAVTQKPTGLLGNETLQPLYLASGAASKENT